MEQSLIAKLLSKYLAKDTELTTKAEGYNVMKPAKQYKTVGWLTFILFGLLFLFFIAEEIFDLAAIENISNPEYFYVFFLFFLLGPLYLILWERRQRVYYNESKILFKGILGSKKEVMWSEILKVSFSYSFLQFYIYSKNTKIVIHKHLSGFDAFTDMLRKSVDPVITDRAIKNLMKAIESGR